LGREIKFGFSWYQLMVSLRIFTLAVTLDSKATMSWRDRAWFVARDELCLGNEHIFYALGHKLAPRVIEGRVL
jgi:hypothetical protein